MGMKNILIFVLVPVLSMVLFAQDEPNGLPSFTDGQEIESNFATAAESVQRKLEQSISELNKLREQIAAEHIPLSRKLSDLESELVEVRIEYQKTTRLLDSRALDLSNLRSEIKSRQEEATYISNLLGEYVRNFESRLHIAEVQRYREALETAKLAPENSNLSEQEIFEAQAALLAVSLERLGDALGGTRFEGTATDSVGSIHHGTFVLVGPAALFMSDDGTNIGTAEQRLGSLEPTIIAFGNEADADVTAEVVSDSAGLFPLDSTLGNAHKIEGTKETLLGHIKKGGPVMYPIFGLAGAALLVAVFKWLSLAFLRKPSQKRINALLNSVAEHDEQAVRQQVKTIKGPVGRMLSVAVEHIKEPRELIEEVMYEKVLATRLKLERFLPFIAISAASAPLLGLLGTVTGIINTFKLITVFGSGDVKTLSGGISEALITTEFGLIVAIPSLLMHAFLSRKARGIVNEMEKTAVAFVNQVSKAPFRKEDSSEVLSKLSSEQLGVLLQNTGRRERAIDDTPVSQYAQDSAGAFMNTRVVSVSKTSTVAETIDKLRCAEVGKDTDVVFVVDENGKYAGHVLVTQLLIRPENTLLESLTEINSRFVRVDTKRDEVRTLLSECNLNSVPVLDYEDRLVGTINRNGEGKG